MKAAMAVLFILGVAALITSEAAANSSDSMGTLGFKKPLMGASNIDTRNIQTKMAESLHGLEPKISAADDKGDMILNTRNMMAQVPGSKLSNTTFNNPSSNNSTSTNTSILNSTALNRTALNSTVLNTSDVNASAMNGAGLRSTGAPGSGAIALSGRTEAGSEGVSSSSSASVKGFYGVTASRHEMGKSDIKSRMFLSGDFDVDKTVQFQDRGV